LRAISLPLLPALLAAMLLLPTQVAAREPDSVALLARIRVLTEPVLAGRGSGTLEADAAADTVATWFAEAGLQPAFAGSWYQEFPLSGAGWGGEDLAGLTACNVGGILIGSGPLAEEFVIVGAHYDHLGRVEPQAPGAAPPAADEYYPGANDNASGVAVLLELARLAKRTVDQADATSCRSVIFVSFCAEEVGLQGSGFMASHLPVPRPQIVAMLNLDTLGQMNDDRLFVSGVGTTPAFVDLVTAANSGGLDLELGQGGWSGSDHMSFNTKEIPVLFLFGGPYQEYNRPGDVAATIKLPELVRITEFAHRLLTSVRKVQGPLPWVMIGEKTLRDDGDDQEQNRNTWFGSLPDFTEEIEGYPLAGVFDDSPAARAGLQKGDVLIRMAGQPVIDLASFTRVLRAHSPGDVVEVTVLRDARSLNFTVVMGDRKDRR